MTSPILAFSQRASRAARPWRSSAALLAGLVFTAAAHAAPPVVSCALTDTNIFNTGYNGTGGKLNPGDTDSQWQVTDMQPRAPNVSAPPPAGATWHPAHVGNLASFAWSASPYGTAEWISREGGTSGDGDWYYRYQFTLDPSVNPSAFQLNLHFMADNSVAEIYINDTLQAGITGVPQSGSLNDYLYAGYLWANRSQTLLTQNWVTGLNTLVVRVQSDHDYEGFLASIEPTPVCGTVPRVQVTKTATPTVAVGGTVNYSVTAANTGSVAAPGTVVTDTLPAGLTNVSWNCTATGGAVCPAATGNASLAETIATFPAGGRVVYAITATVPATAATGTLTNTATLTPPTGGVCDGPGGACNSSVNTTVTAAPVVAVPTLGQWALLLLSLLVGLSLFVLQRRAQR